MSDMSTSRRGRSVNSDRDRGGPVDPGDRGFQESETKGQATLSLRNEASLFMNLAAPSVVIQIGIFWMWLLNSMYVGTHLGPQALAAMSLANLTGNLTGLSLIFGILSAIDTLAPQAIGAGKEQEVAVLGWRGLIASTIIIPICAGVWIDSERVLLLVNQPPDVAKLASHFLIPYALSMPLYVAFETMRKILSCQNIVRPFVWITLLSSFLIHPQFLDYFVAQKEYGIAGTAYALACTYSVMVLLTVLHMRYNKPKSPSRTWIFFFDSVHHPETIPSFNLDIEHVLDLEGMAKFGYLGFFGIISNTEWWYWEAIAFIAGQCGSVELAAHAIAYNVLPMGFMVPFGMSLGLTTRVGTLLGAGEKQMAKVVAKWAIILGWVLEGTIGLIVFVNQDYIISSFTEDPEVVLIASKIWPLLSVFLLVDGTFGLLRGILLALGQQFKMSVATIVVLWCIGLPVTIHYVFEMEGGIDGLWHIMPLTYFSFDVLLAAVVFFSPWVADRKSVV